MKQDGSAFANADDDPPHGTKEISSHEEDFGPPPLEKPTGRSLESVWRDALPGDDDRRLKPPELLHDWLRYQRHEFVRKLRDLTPEGLVAWAIPPVELSVLGLVRHMTQMEHVYLAWGLAGGQRVMVYGEDDYTGGSTETLDENLRMYFAEIEKADRAIADMPSLDSTGAGHGRPFGATLVKMIDEYALHAGQAHMLRFAALGEIVR